MQKKIFFVLLAVWVGFSGCAPRSGQQNAGRHAYMTPNDCYVQPFGNILQGSYTTGDVLAAELEEKGFDPNGPLLSASFVNNDNLEASSSLGRLLSEQISSRLAQHGINVKEVKLRKSTLYIRHQEGEFMLSRELKNLGLDFDAQAALVGTYSVTPLRIFLTTKIVRTVDNTVIASHDYTLAQNAITRELVR